MNLTSNPKSADATRSIAYILVKCRLGCEAKLAARLNKVEGVVAVNQVCGAPYDLFVKVACDIKQLDRSVWKIRRLEDIVLTQTMLVLGTS